MKCSICGLDFVNPGLKERELCNLCHHLASSGMPYKYLKATKALYKNGLLKCFDTNNSLYIYGNIGTGKTWLMSALMRDHAYSTLKCYGEAQTPVYKEDSLFVSFPELVLEIKASMDKGSSTTESRIMDKYGNVKHLFFDDIGAEKTTDYMMSILFVLIERRNTIRNGRTIITSNLSLNQLAKQHGERIASRISEMCRVIKISGTDRRINPRKD